MRILFLILTALLVAVPIWAQDPCDGAVPGDADGNGTIEFADVEFIENYLCADGPAPNPMGNADVDGNCQIDTLDIIYLTQYLDGTGPAPEDCTCGWVGKWKCNASCCGDPADGKYPPGDVNGDYMVNIVDAHYILCWIFFGCDDPPCMEAADTNADGSIGIVDGSYIINYIFFGGGAPRCRSSL